MSGAKSEESAEDAYRAQAREDLRRNYLAYLVHGMFGQTGMRLINAPTFIPAYVHMISGSDVVVGLARSLQYFGMFLSPFLGANLIESRRRVLPVGFAVGAAMRLCVLGIALSGLVFPYFLGPSARLVGVCVFLGLFGFFLGMQVVVFNFLMSKVIPVERRGTLIGLRNALSGMISVVVAYLGGSYLIESNALGDGYGATFLLAFGLTSIGLMMLLFVREPLPPAVRERTGLFERLSQLPALLRSDPGFARYFVARAFATMGRMALPYYVLHAGSSIELTGTSLGLLSSALLLSQTLTNLLWGLLADRSGFRRVFILSLAVWLLAVFLLLASSELWHFAIVFGGIGAGVGGFQLSAQSLVLEFGSRENLPMRLAVASAASELVGAIGPLLGGVIAALWSYPAVFAVGIVFQAVSIVVVVFFVDEPRWRRTARL